MLHPNRGEGIVERFWHRVDLFDSERGLVAIRSEETYFVNG
jgi:hypothetical protein